MCVYVFWRSDFGGRVEGLKVGFFIWIISKIYLTLTGFSKITAHSFSPMEQMFSQQIQFLESFSKRFTGHLVEAKGVHQDW